MKRIANFFRRAKNAVTVAVIGALVAVSSTSHAAVGDLIDNSTGDVVFTPGVLITPLIDVIIMTIVAASSIFLIVVGMRWIYRLARGRG
jgi:hypothetical protein